MGFSVLRLFSFRLLLFSLQSADLCSKLRKLRALEQECIPRPLKGNPEPLDQAAESLMCYLQLSSPFAKVHYLHEFHRFHFDRFELICQGQIYLKCL